MAVIDRLYTILGYKYDQTGFREFERKAEQARRRLNDMGRQAIRMGTKLTAATAGNVLLFSSYEKEMSKIVGLVGISREQLQQWQADIRAIASETGQAPKQLAQALFFITSAGLRGSDAMDLLRSSARAAASGLGEQATIAQLAASAMNAYGTENLTAARAMDVLTEAVRLGQLEPSTLASAMGQILPVASKLQVDFSEIGGLMAAMSRTGTEAQTAAVQLTQVMVAMLRPATSASKALESVGLDMRGLREQITREGLFSALVTINDALGSNEEALAKVFPNVRALRGVFDLLGANLQDNVAIMEEMADSTGVADEAFEAGADTMDRKYRQAMADVKFAMIDLGKAAVPVFVKMTEWIKAITRWFDDLSPRTKTFLGYLTLLGPALLAVGFAMKTAAAAVWVFQGAIKMVALVKALTVAVWGLVAAMRALAAGQGAAGAMTAFRGATALMARGVGGAAAVGAVGGATRAGAAGAAGAAGGAAAARRAPRGRVGGAAKGAGIIGAALVLPEIATQIDDELDASSGWWSDLSDKIDRWGNKYLGLPMGAKGAIVTRPTIAMIGEEKPEAVVPLDRMPGAMRLPPLPNAPPPGEGGTTVGDVNLRVTIDRIEIMAEGGDPEEISSGFGDALRTELRQVVEEFDTMIRA